MDKKKIGTDYIYGSHRVPVVHFSELRPPFVTCVALDRTNGAFEANVNEVATSLKLVEGKDYFHFC